MWSWRYWWGAGWTIGGRTSLWQDLYHRRGAVEAEYLNGEIVRMGCQYGVPTPYNSLLLERITAMAVARALPGTYTVQQLWARVRA
jgi:2-dehydropantoate 2-reductase